MGDIINSFKDKLSSSFASADVFKDDEGFKTYTDFKGELPENEVEEKWSKKYKDSINCNNPKGFSQKAHCQGKKKKEMSEEKLKGGTADNKKFEDLVNKNKSKGKDISIIEKELKTQLNKGIKVELEHTKDKTKAKEIAMDHLFEDPKYYDKLKKIEGKEATGAGSAGGYSQPLFSTTKKEMEENSFKAPKLTMFSDENEDVEKIETKEATGAASSGQYTTNAIWAKSTSKKDWRGKSKPQIPGGKFVTIKKKCKTFPYCNQGDIKALKIYENEVVKSVISRISKNHNIGENVIKSIIQHEIENYKNKPSI